MTLKQIREKVEAILQGPLHLTIASPEDDLIAGGQMDSLALIELLTHLEADFGVQLDLAALDLDDMRSAASIAAVVQRRLAS